jgi:CheY-like chemotaxis protein
MTDRVLVIDDERIILELTSMILRSKGYEVLTAESGRLGLEIVERERCKPASSRSDCSCT